MGLLGSEQKAYAAYQAAKSEREAARKTRRLLSEFYGKQEQLAGAASEQERERYLQQLNMAQRQAQQQYRWAEQRASAELLNTMASPAYQAQAAFLADMFNQGIPQSMADEYSGRLRQAQAARGLSRGGAATRDEAALLTNMAHTSRMQLLPQLRQLGLDPLQLKLSTTAQLLQTRAQAEQLGLAQFQAAMAGAAGAQEIANMRTIPLAQLGAALYGQMPYSAASPKAYAAAQIGSALQQTEQQAISLFGSAAGGALGGR